MSKKKSKKAAVIEAPLSKKERKALAAEAARIERELAERKAAKKKAKKAKAEKPRTPSPAEQAAADAKAERAAKRAAKKAARSDREADVSIAAVEEERRSTPLSAGPELDAALAADTDAAIKARVQAKRLARERDERLAAQPAKVAAARAERAAAAKVGETIHDEDGDAYMIDSDGVPVAVDSIVEKATAAFDEAERRAVEKTREAVAAIGQAIDVVETEAGREFVAGAADAPVFANPSEAPRDDFVTNGNGQYLVQRPSDGKLVGYTRVTTYIACLEDTTALEKWKARILLEGVASVETPDEHGKSDESVVVRVNGLVHNRDLAIAKARKADKKGKLEHGQLAVIVNGAWSDFKKALDKLADEVFEVGGGREKATKGTDIHELCAIAARDGIQPIADMFTEGTITPSDMADVEAFLDAITRLGAKILDIERVVVNDDLKVAGRLDYVAMVKLPGEQRARRRVLDLKTGRVDYGTGKIAQQLEMYAGATGYDLNTHEREDLKLDRAKGILIHLPAGTGKATVHVADLTLGRKGNRLAAEVRAWRNEGKRAIDLKVDVLAELAKEA